MKTVFEHNKTSEKKQIKKQKLEEEFKKYKGENLAKNFSWDEPIGKEILEEFNDIKELIQACID